MNAVELLTSWFTPTVLFCVLNVMIGTIFITSTLKTPPHSNNDDLPPPQLVRVPSFFERVNSFNLSNYHSPQPDPPHHATRPNQGQHATPKPPQSTKDDISPPPPQQLVRVPSFFERVKSFNLSNYQTTPQPDPIRRETRPDPPEHEKELEHHVIRSKSGSVEQAAPAARVLQKSASEKVPAEKEEERRRPATTRERVAEQDEAVDEKADDFINKFRQQLKLQRLDSILRYKEMLNRGAGR